MKRKSEKLASACATCPYRRANQTAAARASAPKAKGSRFRWYDVANVRRLLNGAKGGHPTICHATDPKAPEYAGKDCKPGHERICVGQLIIVARMMDVVNARARAQQPGRFKPWDGLFTRAGMIAWVERFMFRGTPLGPSADLMPTAFAGADEVRVPWDDPVLNAGALDPIP